MGRNRQKTWPGAILSICTMGIVFTVSIFNGLHLVQRTDPEITSYQISRKMKGKSMDLGALNFELAFSFTNVYSQKDVVIDPSIVTVVAKTVTVKNNNYATPTATETIAVKKCEAGIHFRLTE